MNDKIIYGENIENMNEKFMKEALKEAKKAYEADEIPIGAVIVKNDKIIARAHNQKEIKNDATRHAEIIAIEKASKKLQGWRLDDCEMYVTLEPCMMCAGAIVQARLKKVYIGAMDEKMGYCGSVINLLQYNKYDYHVESESGILSDECSKIVKDFFAELRNKKSKH